MKTNQQIIDYFCGIMEPWSPENIRIIRNDNIGGELEIDSDWLQLNIFKLMEKFLTEESTNEIDIGCSDNKLRISWNYKYDPV